MINEEHAKPSLLCVMMNEEHAKPSLPCVLLQPMIVANHPCDEYTLPLGLRLLLGMT